MKSLAPNTLIQNRYLIVQLIGKGGMGEVYLAVDQRLGSAVALKRTYFADDEMLGGAFEREARTLARLRHPVLPKVSDHFSDNGDQYLVMEHISGDDLSKRLEAAQKPFPSSWVLFWADQLLDALSYLHSHEPPIIHRDIKPQNLKLTDENHIVLLDFGLSKNSTGNTNVSSGSKSSGSVVGYTPHYAPMEQIRGTGTGPRSDLYSLSATLYQLMTNVIPADALTRADALLNGMSDPIEKISDLTPEISPGVSDVILHGMEVSQEKRYDSARVMQKALRKAYTAMQEAMSANTMVFNSQELQKDAIESTGNTNPEPSISTPSADDLSSFPSASASPEFEQPVSGTQPNLDATVQYDASSAPLRQADVKTEVYRAEDLPLPGYEAQTPADSYPSEPTPPVENYNPTENYSSSETGFSPDSTVPLISMEGVEGLGTQSNASSPEFFTTPNVNAQADSFATVTPGRSGADEDTATPPVEQKPTARVTPAKKKSSSKLIFALGGLALLFVLGLALAGGGYYVYDNYYATSPTPTPSPERTLETTPSPESTANSTIDNSNSDSNSNTNSNSNSLSNSNGGLTVSPTPFPTSTPIIESTPVPRPTQTRENPQPRPTRSPSSKPPPTPRPRPSILG